jgi:hypothetical protein
MAWTIAQHVTDVPGVQSILCGAVLSATPNGSLPQDDSCEKSACDEVCRKCIVGPIASDHDRIIARVHLHDDLARLSGIDTKIGRRARVGDFFQGLYRSLAVEIGGCR